MIAVNGNETHGTFADLLAVATPQLRLICVALRRLISAEHSEFTEIVWPRQKIASYGVGPKKMSEHYAYIAVLTSHVNLGFYHGAGLADPDGLLEGSGKGLRHVKIRDVRLAGNPSLKALLRRAIVDRQRTAGPAGQNADP
jgi:hypothetical protein